MFKKFARRLLLALCTAMLITAGAFPLNTTASGQDRFNLGYMLVWSSLPKTHLVSGDLTYDRQRRKYEMTYTANVRIFFPRIQMDGVYNVSGVGPQGARAPKNFAMDWNGNLGSDRIRARWPEPGGAPEVSPEPDNWARQRPHLRGAVDPITYLALVYEAVEKSDGLACDVDKTVWDGVKYVQMISTLYKSVRGNWAQCRVAFRLLPGSDFGTPWDEDEATTLRLARFYRDGLTWQPDYISIEGRLFGWRSEIRITFFPRD